MEGFEFRTKVGGIITHSRKTRFGKDYVKNEAAFREIIKDMKVLAWASSEDKYLLVTGLKNEGFVIGVTGINPADTKSLLKADVGFSLNELGSEVAKHSSDIILKDDSLASFVSAIMWGRNLYTGVKRYAQYYVTFILVLSFTILISVLVQGHIPLHISHLLLLYLLSDPFAMHCLIKDKPSSTMLLENYNSSQKKLFTPTMFKTIFLNSWYQIVVLAVVGFETDRLLNWKSYNWFGNYDRTEGIMFSIIFQILFYFQISTIVLSRNVKSFEFDVVKGIYNNSFRFLLVIVADVLTVTYGESFLQFAPLSIKLHIFTAWVGLSPLLWLTTARWFISSYHFKYKLNDHRLDWNDVSKCIQHYLRKPLSVPSKIPVKQTWRSNSQNQYDTKGKKTITWGEDEESGSKVEESKNNRSNLASQLKENFRKQEYEFIQS